MASKHDTLYRQWLMLRHIPRFPAKITAGKLKDKLASENLTISKRTVERDLLELSGIFPLVLDDRERPYGWSWQKDAPTFNLPGLSNNEALTLALVEQHLIPLLPSSTLEVLAPHFHAARQHLAAMPATTLARGWLDKVRSLPAAQPLLPALIDPDVQRSVTEALLKENQLQVSYRKKGHNDSIEYRVHPLAMVQRGGVLYLYVRMFDYSDTRMLAMHRVTRADIFAEKVVYPEGFAIDQEIAQGRFGFGDGSTIELHAVFTKACGEHLTETPLAHDQVIEFLQDGRMLMKATVASTPQLVWWLLGMADGVVVLEPVALRQRIAEAAARTTRAYERITDLSEAEVLP